jgi:hypothetical protein
MRPSASALGGSAMAIFRYPSIVRNMNRARGGTAICAASGGRDTVGAGLDYALSDDIAIGAVAVDV